MDEFEASAKCVPAGMTNCHVNDDLKSRQGRSLKLIA
jgi:hypothetical protein